MEVNSMNKNQALAAMDARMVPVIAEHQRRLQKRQRFMLRLYPVLKRAPSEKRAELLQEAARYAFRQWTVYATLGLLVGIGTFLLREQIFGVVVTVPDSIVWLLSAMSVAPAAVLWAHIRGYLALLVGATYEQDHEATSRRVA
jgi:hypothetical protein